MAANDYRRVEVGFDHGPVVPLRLEQSAYDKLTKALSDGGERWHLLESEDSTITLDLSKVVFVRLDTERDRVGF
jgi:hypothetical protein